MARLPGLGLHLFIIPVSVLDLNLNLPSPDLLNDPRILLAFDLAMALCLSVLDIWDCPSADS